MEFKDFRRDIKSLHIDDLRNEDDNYFEAVLLKTEMDKLKERLKKFFGDPVFPSSGKLPAHTEKTIQDFGGVRRNQTLYFKDEGKNSLFAMLWPWDDGWHTTLKMGRR